MPDNNDSTARTESATPKKLGFVHRPIPHSDTAGCYPEGDVFDDSEFLAGAVTIEMSEGPSGSESDTPDGNTPIRHEFHLPPPPSTAIYNPDHHLDDEDELADDGGSEDAAFMADAVIVKSTR